MFRRKLLALEYPRAEQFTVQDTKEFQTLVLWLEETKIRFYSMDDREPLRKVDAPGWPAAFAKYLKDVQCTRPYSDKMSPDDVQAVMDWLLGNAVTAEYSDHAAQYNQVGKQEATSSSAASGSQQTLDCSSKEFSGTVSLLASALQLPQFKDVEAAVVLRVVVQRLQHRAAGDSKQPVNKSGDQKDADAQAEVRTALADLEQLPLGFDTQDRVLNQAARLLRLLYISELRDLQTVINEILVLAQEYTARQSEMADTRLGQVGR